MTWTVTELEDALESLRARKGDSAAIEVKRAAGGLPEKLGETTCAFANMPDGGTIVLGVDEPGFDIVGVSQPAKLEAGLVSQARNAINPSPRINTSTLEIHGAYVVVAEVVPLPTAERPARYQGRAYLRQSDGDYVMQEHELRMLEVDKLHASEREEYDKHPVTGLTQDDLVPALVEGYLARSRAADPRLTQATDAQILRWTGVLRSSGEPTIAGLYALGYYPQGEFPSLTVTAAVQLPAATARTKNLKDFTGPVPVLLDELLAWVEQNLASVRRYRTDGHMVQDYELPLKAIRELLANALVHRDLGPNTLGLGKSIQIRLTEAGLFVMSPGGLHGVSREQLESSDHAQAAVNQRLYSIAKKLRTSDGASVIEGEGGGLRVVFDSAADAGLRRPTLTDSGVQFKAMLWRPDPAGTAPSRRPTSQASMPDHPGATLRSSHSNSTLVTAALADGPLALRELSHSTGLTRGQLYYTLKQLKAAGRVAMMGSQGDRRTTYTLTGRPHTDHADRTVEPVK